MKFGNGCWLQKEGIECFAPQEAYFVNKNDHEVVICAPTHHIAHRGDNLGGINLTIPSHQQEKLEHVLRKRR